MSDKLLGEIIDEYDRAVDAYPPMHSAHEGFAVLLEEVDELKAEVWKKPSGRSKEKMRAEAIQIAAMAIRFIEDCCGGRGVKYVVKSQHGDYLKSMANPFSWGHRTDAKLFDSKEDAKSACALWPLAGARVVRLVSR